MDNKRIRDLVNWIKSDLSQEENPKLTKTQHPYRMEKTRFLRRAEDILTMEESKYKENKRNYIISELGGVEKYNTDPIVKTTIDNLINGSSEIKVIGMLLEIIEKQTKLNTELTLKSMGNGKL